ncbi:MAG: hypothetical protein EZS28_004526 [Streblomastix strix]|uniref:Uncharacterized protein n=1 Tax=Streblomastix strix TaxID=222440 RepID=A0A5J4WZH8_9EUKA|nr:MAG: hypothetical protein EZS28_004526 [Streblomastix strix]
MNESIKDHEILELKQKLKQAEEERNREKSQREREKRRANDAEAECQRYQIENCRLVMDVANLNKQLAERSYNLPKKISPGPQSQSPPPQQPQPAGSINYIAIPPSPDLIEISGDTFTNISKEASTIVFDPPITSGIARIEILNLKNLNSIGVAHKSVNYNRGEHPDKSFFIREKVVMYHSQCYVQQIFTPLWGNSTFHGSGHKMAMELNMVSNPRTLTFFVNNIEQKNYIVGVITSLRFFANLYDAGSQFQVTKFEYISESAAKHGPGTRALQWGKDWDREEKEDEKEDDDW